MKAQLVKTFIKAAAILTLGISIANCGAMPEESITESTYQPTSENTDKTTNNDDEEETTNKTPSRSTEPVKEGCEAFGFRWMTNDGSLEIEQELKWVSDFSKSWALKRPKNSIEQDRWIRRGRDEESCLGTS